MAETGTQFDLNIFVDKEKGRFLYAEADGDFVNVLFTFLTLPLKTIVRLIAKTQSEPAPTVGCLGLLYQTVMELRNHHFDVEMIEDIMLHPLSSSEDRNRRLEIVMDDDKDADKYYFCPNLFSGCTNYNGIYCKSKCCDCGSSKDEVKGLEASGDSSEGKVFVSKASRYIVMDNLQVKPVVPGTFIDHLNNLGIDDSSKVEERTVKLGVDELVKLLKRTLLSTTPLTDLFVSKTNRSVPEKESPQKTLSGEGRKINIKAVLNKSSKELLYVEAGGDFIDFLFNLLFIPLAEVLHVSEGQSGLGCIDGLYKSAQSLDSQHLSSEDHKDIMDRLFPLRQEFVGEEAVFIVLDNLAVARFSSAIAMSIINMMKVSISDLEERTLSVGLAEGISILRASLNSTSAISNGLLHNCLVEPK